MKLANRLRLGKTYDQTQFDETSITHHFIFHL